jgi:DMSO reductase anchor subunit
MHLGKPHFLYRGFYNLRLSPVSREIAGVSLFFTGLIATLILKIFQLEFLLNFAYGLTLLGFGLGSYYMYKLYRIPARPFWNHWQTGSHFYGTILSLGSIFFAMLLVTQTIDKSSIIIISGVAIIGVLLEIAGHIAHTKHNQKTGESQASHFEQTTSFGKTYTLRNGLILLNLLLLVSLVIFPNQWVLYVVFVNLLTSQYLSRILFYALVIPTTMPGAFFWKNDKFKAHATEVGLDNMPQVGIIAPRHHKFDFKELFKVVRKTTPKSAFKQIKSIVFG